MGRGSYTSNDWSKLRSSRGLTSESVVTNVFSSTHALPAYDSRGITMRESRDSEDSPLSTPIIIGFDVTASMGYLAKELAVNSINSTILSIYEKNIVPNPHVLCSAIGDCKSDSSPLQATQFEADIRIINQLTDLFLEGGGGGNGGESYNLLWYFAAKHTATDCFEKRQKKGFLFTIGDDKCHSDLSVMELKNVFSDSADFSLSNEELLRMARQRYNVFHIHIETGHFNDSEIFYNWRKIMPGYCTVIHKNDINCLSGLITSIISVASGKSINETLKSIGQNISEKIARSMAYIQTENKKTNTIAF